MTAHGYSFVSRSDAWIQILLTISNLMLAGGVAILFLGQRLRFDRGELILGFLLMGVLVCTIWMQVGTRYSIDGDELLVRCGPIRWRIAIPSIDRVTATDDPSSGPALSLRRLRIDYASKGSRQEILVSPANQAGFIEALRARNPGIESA